MQTSKHGTPFIQWLLDTESGEITKIVTAILVFNLLLWLDFIRDFKENSTKEPLRKIISWKPQYPFIWCYNLCRYKVFGNFSQYVFNVSLAGPEIGLRKHLNQKVILIPTNLFKILNWDILVTKLKITKQMKKVIQKMISRTQYIREKMGQPEVTVHNILLMRFLFIILIHLSLAPQHS